MSTGMAIASARPGRSAVALKDAGLSALVALGLFAAMLGTETVATATRIQLVPRPLLLAGAVLTVFAGRLAWLLLREAAPRRAYAGNRRLAETLRRGSRYLAPALLAVALLLPVIGGRYTIDTGILILTYVMLGWGLNIVVGLAGLLDLGYVAFYAVGAYSYGLLATTYGLGFWTCLPLAGILAAFCGVLLGFPVLRLRGDYLAIVTLGFGEIIRVFLLNSYSLTGGSNGLSGIPGPTLFGLRFSTAGGPGTVSNALGFEATPVQRFIFLYYIILALALLTNWVTLRLRRVALGRAWEALREDEIACRSLGINVTVTKLTAFAIGAGFGGLAGAFFATRASFITPESFTFFESALILAIVVLGGMGSQLGVALAATVLIGMSEVMRDFGAYRNLIFGGAMVLTMILRPRGLVSGRTPSVALGQRREIPAEMVAEGRG